MREKESAFLTEIMVVLVAATSKEEFKERLKAVQAPQSQNIQDKEASNSNNYF